VTPLEWTSADLVFASRLDSEHRKLFEQVKKVRQATAPGAAGEAGLDLWRLSRMLSIHLNSEERLMREHRYPALDWHRRQHQAGRKKMSGAIEAGRGGGEPFAGAMDEFVKWLKDHVHLADRMFAAYLRNQQWGNWVS
jgi:hemerythrin-like metal-binding protein